MGRITDGQPSAGPKAVAGTAAAPSQARVDVRSGRPVRRLPLKVSVALA
ncbi:hypothetical protein AOPFMNJM_3641 [Methylobacterium jeotgali]|jgi:hypothetical protein|uniref:Uncharacterized protein n=1 Tax=Methylobacterium jeotgali TaxID=381630 RepID=A0ABQ4T0K0_9HYPH|nr:hypothetical protein AOPFMNJM_3641 [Methylobacterium jeotgali]